MSIDGAEMTMVNYTSRAATDRHIRDDRNLRAELISSQDAKDQLETVFYTDEDQMGWNDVNPEVNRYQREAFIKDGNPSATFFYSMIHDLVEFIRVNWQEQYGPSWVDRDIQLYIFTDAVHFFDDVVSWQQADTLSCDNMECTTCVEKPYSMSVNQICQLTSALEETFKAGIRLVPTSDKPFEKLGCKMGDQFTDHLKQCGSYNNQRSPFVLFEEKPDSLDVLTETISELVTTEGLCCKSGQLTVSNSRNSLVLPQVTRNSD